MQISVAITLGSDDNLAYTPDQAATQVLAALGGNPTTDSCYVTVVQQGAGSAGVPPPEDTALNPPAAS